MNNTFLPTCPHPCWSWKSRHHCWLPHRDGALLDPWHACLCVLGVDVELGKVTGSVVVVFVVDNRVAIAIVIVIAAAVLTIQGRG